MKSEEIRKIADKLKKITKSDIKKIVKELAEAYDNEVVEGMSAYGEEAFWKIDKFMPETRDFLADIETTYLKDFEFKDDDEKRNVAMDVQDEFSNFLSSYISKNWKKYYIEDEE